jgi:hypothetical protein
VLAAWLLGFIAPPFAGAAERVPNCLTPAVGSALSEVVAAGGLTPVLAAEFTLARTSIQGNHIEVEIRDRDQRAYAVTLALPGSGYGEQHDKGRLFLFHLAPPAGPPNPRATAALLAIASIFDAAIPDTALVPCPQTDRPREREHQAPAETGQPQARGERRYPRWLALAGAAAQLAIIVAACLYGAWALAVDDANSRAKNAKRNIA